MPTPLVTMLGVAASVIERLNAGGISAVEELASLAPEDLQNIPGIGDKTIEKISDAMSEYYTQSPAYQDQMERLAQQVMFSKDAPAPEATDEESKETSDANAPEE